MQIMLFCNFGVWLVSGRFVDFRLKGRGFESCSSRHVGPWASPSLAVAFGASARNSDTVSVIVSGAPLSSSGHEEVP